MERTDDITQDPRIAALEAMVAELAAKTEALAADNERLATDNASLSDSVSSLRQDLDAANARIAEVTADRDRLVAQIMQAQAMQFGYKSEKLHPWQLSLFNDMEASFDPDAAEPAADDVAAPRKPRKKRACTDWSKFDTVVIEHRDPKPECPACGTPMDEMGYSVKRVFKVVPARVYVEEHRAYKYVCPACSDANQEDGGATLVQITAAPMPAVTPIEGSCASASLVAHVIGQKYSLGLPIYRVSADLRATAGLTITRQAMSGWVIKAWVRWLSKVFALMRERMLSSKALHIDETRIQCLKEPGRSPSSMSWAWVFCTLESDVPIFCFHYDPSRGHEVPHAFLPADWRGTVVADGHSAYTSLLAKRPGMGRVSCLVHIRRYFANVLKSGAGERAGGRELVANQALARIAAMFRLESELAGLGADARKAAREERLRPLLDGFTAWIADVAPSVIPGTKLHEAVTYASKQAPYLYNALADGDLPLDNNRAERAIRPFAVGRRAWLFSDTQAGARASCGIYSIVTTARANGLDPVRYVEWLLEELPNAADPDDRGFLETLMPWSASVPAGCRKNAGTVADEMSVPAMDIDPHTFDEG